jgi:hypothetical protein
MSLNIKIADPEFDSGLENDPNPDAGTSKNGEKNLKFYVLKS